MEEKDIEIFGSKILDAFERSKTLTSLSDQVKNWWFLTDHPDEAGREEGVQEISEWVSDILFPRTSQWSWLDEPDPEETRTMERVDVLIRESKTADEFLDKLGSEFPKSKD